MTSNDTGTETARRSDDVYLHEGFENGVGAFESVRVPSAHRDEAMQFVEEPTRAGGQALQLHAKHPDRHGWDYGDVNNIRVEVGMHANRWDLWNDGMNTWGEPFWVGFSVYVPADWEPDDTYNNVAEFHANLGGQDDNVGPGGGVKKPFTMNFHGEELMFRNDYQTPDGEGERDFVYADYTPGEWHDVVLHVEWARYDDDHDGFMRIWLDGEQVYDHEGATAINHDDPPRPLKLSIYKGLWDDDTKQFDTDREYERTLVFDEVRLARDQAGYEAVAPGGGDDGDDDGDDGQPAHTVSITKDDQGVADGRVEYDLAASAALSATDDVELGGNDSKDGLHASGGMGPKGGTDTWAFEGVLTEFTLSGDANVYVNGQQVSPEAVVGQPAFEADYDLPTRGEADWHEPLNETFATIEGDVRALATVLVARDGGDGPDAFGGYERPSAGTGDWHRPLNENFGAIAADVSDLADRLAAVDGGAGSGAYGDYATPSRGADDWNEPVEDNAGVILADLTDLRDRLADADRDGGR